MIMFKSLVEEGRIIFVCKRCRAERNGSEPRTCEHKYSDYIVKGGRVYENLFGEVKEAQLKI